MDTERGEVAKAGAQRASPTPQDDPSREIMTTRENAEIREIKIYDTMSRAKRVLEPIEPGKICMYVCGVTVYDLSHIGHARTFVTFDVVQRFLRHVGYDVKFVRNHTDVDDKIIARAAEKNIPALELSANFIDAFNEDMAALGLMPPDVEPKVSTHIPEIIEMVETLIEKGHAYAVESGDVFYRVSSFEGYGKLSRRELEDQEAGRSGRVGSDVDQKLDKEHPFDFALWKASKDGEVAWESPWGMGRPGWHIECSAMSTKHLGVHFDIHGGGQDLIFPHHENEIAQSEGCSGHDPLCNYWMHVSMLNVDGVKMGKSLGNFWTVRDVLEQFHPEAVRFFMYTAHYRNVVNYSLEALNEATRRVVYLYDALTRIDEALAKAGVSAGDEPPTQEWFDKRGEQVIAPYMDRFEEALADDFNTSLAISLLQEQAKIANDLTQSKKKPKTPAVRTLLAIRENLTTSAEVLALLQREPAEALLELRDLSARAMNLDIEVIEQKLVDRDQARADKEWARADEIRDELLAMQVEVMDSNEGTTWRIHYQED